MEYDANSEAGTGLLIAIIKAIFAIPTVMIIAVVYAARRRPKR